MVYETKSEMNSEQITVIVSQCLGFVEMHLASSFKNLMDGQYLATSEDKFGSQIASFKGDIKKYDLFFILVKPNIEKTNKLSDKVE
jgi:hypothetical protein